MSIPRVIFQTHKLPLEQLPPRLKSCVIEWRDMNSDYEFRYFDDEALERWMRENSSEMIFKLFEMLKARSGASAVDLWRIQILLNEGGIYADADSKAVALEQFVEHDAQAMSFGAGGKESPFGDHFSPMHSLMIFGKDHLLLVEMLAELTAYHVAKGQYWAHGQSMPVEFESGPGCFNRAWMRMYGFGPLRAPCVVGTGPSEVRIIDSELVRGLGWSHKALENEDYIADLNAMKVKRYD